MTLILIAVLQQSPQVSEDVLREIVDIEKSAGSVWNSYDTAQWLAAHHFDEHAIELLDNAFPGAIELYERFRADDDLDGMLRAAPLRKETPDWLQRLHYEPSAENRRRAIEEVKKADAEGRDLNLLSRAMFKEGSSQILDLWMARKLYRRNMSSMGGIPYNNNLELPDNEILGHAPESDLADNFYELWQHRWGNKVYDLPPVLKLHREKVTYAELFCSTSEQLTPKLMDIGVDQLLHRAIMPKANYSGDGEDYYYYLCFVLKDILEKSDRDVALRILDRYWDWIVREIVYQDGYQRIYVFDLLVENDFTIRARDLAEKVYALASKEHRSASAQKLKDKYEKKVSDAYCWFIVLRADKRAEQVAKEFWGRPAELNVRLRALRLSRRYEELLNYAIKHHQTSYFDSVTRSLIYEDSTRTKELYGRITEYLLEQDDPEGWFGHSERLRREGYLEDLRRLLIHAEESTDLHPSSARAMFPGWAVLGEEEKAVAYADQLGLPGLEQNVRGLVRSSELTLADMRSYGGRDLFVEGMEQAIKIGFGRTIAVTGSVGRLFQYWLLCGEDESSRSLVSSYFIKLLKSSEPPQRQEIEVGILKQAIQLDLTFEEQSRFLSLVREARKE